MKILFAKIFFDLVTSSLLWYPTAAPKVAYFEYLLGKYDFYIYLGVWLYRNLQIVVR